ncbi:hypothetical protein Q9Q94_11890 [Uliginosibacterium sp. 31-16]|uniref:hypothetical protein n=1 Tax=Uliginosibacterium sp. 31-16 TaxID=3068315 RepID=UPI00273D0718|nr:hypothetical protein [Uliginosibacterium sp. 31-16]MDP5240233.1 hypothetical protein [Uliginosibacterium sp. 31-16]
MRKGLFGLPLYEVAVLAVIAAVIIGVLAERADSLLERAEKTAVDTAVMNMRSGLRLEMARRIVAGERLRDLAGTNPLSFLEAPPVGHIPANLPDLAKTVKSGLWQYKSDENALYYVPQRRRHLKMQQGNVDKTLVWQVLPSTSDGEQVEVVLMTPYWWF